MSSDPFPADKGPAEQATPAEGDKAKKGGRMKTGVAVGIGSAAIVAALLYANRSKRKD